MLWVVLVIVGSDRHGQEAAGTIFLVSHALGTVRELCSEDRTILLVSHALASIEKLCDDAIWLHKGRMQMWDEPAAVISIC